MKFGSKTKIALAAGLILVGIPCFGFTILGLLSLSSQPPQYEEGNDLFAARSGFNPTFLREGPAPQEFGFEATPRGASEIKYTSGDLKLKAWVTDDPGDGLKRPAIVFLHGGWAFAREDWDVMTPFINKDFVVMTPMLRGENGNPGFFEHQYGEVNDAIAAGEYVATLPYVDPENIFIAGHSAGAVIAVLVAMMPSRYRAAAAFSGVLENDRFAPGLPDLMPYDVRDDEERRLRNPMAFVASLKIPVFLYVERDRDMKRINRDFCRRATHLEKTCSLEIVRGDHGSMLDAAVPRALSAFAGSMKPAD